MENRRQRLRAAALRGGGPKRAMLHKRDLGVEQCLRAHANERQNLLAVENLGPAGSVRATVAVTSARGIRGTPVWSSILSARSLLRDACNE